MKRARIGFLTLAIALVAGVAQAQQPAPAGPARMPHPQAGKEQCAACHAPTANPHISDTPASHNFPESSCTMCHRPVEARPDSIPHATTDAFAQCRTCHVANSPMGAPAPPAAHAGYNPAICQMCHVPRPRR